MSENNTPIDPTAVNVSCPAAGSSGDKVEQRGGNIYLNITSVGATWTITLVAGG